MKTLIGQIISDKMQGVAVVEVERWITHPVYHKRFRRTRNYHAQNLVGAKKGEVVKIAETKPISKLTNFKIIEKVK